MKMVTFVRHGRAQYSTNKPNMITGEGICLSPMGIEETKQINTIVI